MAAAEGEAHRTAQMDRNAFHRALVTALSDPYTISGRATAEKLKALERVKGGREDSFVLDARYELGKRDDAYLQAPVLPLQTSDDDHEPLGLRLDPLFENAHRSGLYTALLGELRSKVDPDVERLASALRLAGWLLTMPEVYAYVEAAVGGSSLPDPVAAFSDLGHGLGPTSRKKAEIIISTHCYTSNLRTAKITSSIFYTNDVGKFR